MDWQRLEQLYGEAMSLSAEARKRFLAVLAHTEPLLYREIKSLLKHSADAAEKVQGVLDRAVTTDPAKLVQNVTQTMTVDWIGQYFGPYRIARKIASGGMGTVFEAVREDEVSKRVALKVAASAIGSPGWTERFRQERQILAGLEHPNIARFLDGGSSPDGLPYFAMEFVEGEPVTDFITTNNVGLEKRLRLFLKICAAVSYAHQNLIIHRDLKPNNILVTAGGEPKLLDFGVAKLLSPVEAGDPAGVPQTVPMLTPAYCAPEQLTNERITTRTDVHLLGLILSEMLTGEPVRRPNEFSPAEFIEEVCHKPVSAPSVIASRRNLVALAGKLEGDLDTIALKATAIEPGRRYESVDLLAEDVRRYLADEPIEARPASFAYLAGKFAKRHWMPLTAGVLLLASLTAGVVLLAWQARVAERRFQLARDIANTLLFDIHDQVRAMPGASSLRGQLSATSVRYLDALAKEAGRNWTLRRELAEGYLRLSRAKLALREPSAEILDASSRGIALIEGMPQDEEARASLLEAELRVARGLQLRDRGEFDSAAQDYRRVLQITACPADPKRGCLAHLEALEELTDIAVIQRDWPRFDGLLASLAHALQAARRVLGEKSHAYRELRAGIMLVRSRISKADREGAVKTALSLLPLARQVEQQLPSDADTDVESTLVRYYIHLAEHHPASSATDNSQRVVFANKAVEFAKKIKALDPTNTLADSRLAAASLILAQSYQNHSPAAAAAWYDSALSAHLTLFGNDPASVTYNAKLMETAIMYARYLLNEKQPGRALAMAERVAATANLLWSTGLKPQLRNPAFQKLQARWWIANEATRVNSPLAPSLWREAVTDAERLLADSPNDAGVRTCAALVFENQPQDSHRKRALSLWQDLAREFPDNSFLRKRAEQAA